MNIPETIKTERLLLRKFQPVDKMKFLEFMRDEEATKYLMFGGLQNSTDGASLLFDRILKGYDTDHPMFTLAIVLPDAGYIGNCGISRTDKAVWECYYSLNREYWGCGYATEAMEALKNYSFSFPEVRELRAYMHPENPKSAKVAEKIGMTSMGMVKHPVFEKEALLYRKKNI